MLTHKSSSEGFQEICQLFICCMRPLSGRNKVNRDGSRDQNQDGGIGFTIHGD